MNPKHAIAVAGCIAVVAAGAAGVAITSGSAPAAASGQGTPTVEPHFAVIRDTGQSPALDQDDRQLLESMSALTAKYHADWGAARVAMETNAGDKLIVAAGDGYVCFVLSSPNPTMKKVGGGTCASNEDANRDGAAVVTGEAPHATVAGIVPDGVADVTVSFADGSQKRVAVDHNAYVISSPVASESLTFTGPSGTPTTRDLASYGG